MRVVGIGGPGGQAVAQMAMAGLAGVDFVVVDTDRQRLTNTAVPTRIHYDPRALAGSARMTHALYTALQGADMLILIADLPGHDDALRTLLALGRTAGAVVVAL
ncbi:MAG: hypothetical protein KC425_10385, partial [Anaerolineales bacterium]|nr:hypothetical protein [Anaerolineales bacterium]